MKFGKFVVAGVVFSLSVAASKAHAQVKPSATQQLQLSAFGMGDGAYLGAGGGRNLGITVGADLGVRLFSKYLPSIEVRGTFPVADGNLASAKNVLGGIKVERKFFHRYSPYVDILYGRTQYSYKGAGIPNPQETYVYTKSATNTYSLGGGGDVTLTRHFAAKADFQIEHNAVPIVPSSTIYTKRISVGAIYRFDFTGHKFFNR